METYELDIIKNGQIDEIILHEGMILDKWHMYKILIKNNIEPKFKDFHQNGVATPQDFVIAKLQGRHLSISQRACIAAEYCLMNKSGHHERVLKAWKTRREGKGGNNMLDNGAKIFSVSRSVLMKSYRLLHADRDLFDKCKTGEQSVNKAYYKFRLIKPTKQHKSRNEEIEKNIETSKAELKIPQVFDSEEVIEIFVKEMCKRGWILEHKVRDGLHFANFWGNGFPSIWHMIDQEGSSFKYKEAVVRAAFQKIGNK